MAGSAPRGRAGRLGIITAVAALPLAALLWHGPIVATARFHRFADMRALGGLPNALDVLSNLSFFVAAGYAAARAGLRPPSVPGWMWGALCVALAAVGVGSAVYHLHPGDARLLGDFLPIDVLAALLLALVVADRIDARAGAWLAPIAVALFAAGSIAWYVGELGGGGDMRWHAAAQAVSVALLLPAVFLFPDGAIRTGWLLAGVATYLVARACTHLDHEIYGVLGVSGHTLKHLAAGGATMLIVRAATAPPRPPAS